MISHRPGLSIRTLSILSSQPNWWRRRESNSLLYLGMDASTFTCTRCKRDFTPSSLHKLCPSCRDKDAQRSCPACDNPMSKRSKLCRTCSNQLNPRKRHKGGRVFHSAGYVMIREPEHPRSRSNNGYVFEHILVMEQALGRYLHHSESVHHLNGVRDDNRPENLELWVKPQPTGVRASDAISWALETLRRLAPEHLMQ